MLVISPLILSWHTKNFHYVVGLDVDIPIGAYKKEDLANIGRNYWTFEPIVAATYMSRQRLRGLRKIHVRHQYQK